MAKLEQQRPEKQSFVLLHVSKNSFPVEFKLVWLFYDVAHWIEKLGPRALNNKEFYVGSRQSFCYTVLF